MFTIASFGITVSFPSRYRCRPSPKRRAFPQLGVLQRLRPPISTRSAVGAPSRTNQTGCPENRRDRDGSRVHCDSLDGVGARLCPPCGLTTITPPQRFTVVSGPTDLSGPGVPPHQPSVGVHRPPGPYPPDLSRCKMKGRKRRFLAYSFPSRSPDPHHLTVLTRPGFVRAACHPPPRHHPGQAALSFTVLLRQDRRRRSFTSVRINSASRRTGRSLRRISLVPGGQLLRLTRSVASATQAPSRMPPPVSIAGYQHWARLRVSTASWTRQSTGG